MKRILDWFTRLFTKPAPIITPVPQAPAIAYPRVAAYAWMRGNGSPLVVNGGISAAAIEDYARYDVLVLDPYRDGIRAEAQAWLRREMAKRPGTQLLAFVPTCKFFVCAQGWFFGPPIPGCDTEQLAYKRAEVVRDHDALLYGTNGPYLGGGWIDFAQPDLPYALADMVADWIPPIFDGIFCDESPLGITWTQSSGDFIDFRRAGFGSLELWAAAYRRGVEIYFARLCLRFPGKPIVGNGGQLGPRFINGWMRENFPYQNGNPATWETNMLGWPGVAGDVGYMGDGAAYTQPSLNWLSAWGGTDITLRAQKARFVLASATLGDGVGVLTWSEPDPARGKTAWLDEFSVRPDGMPDTTGAHRGWLGRPLGPARRISLAWCRGFERGCVFVNPTSAPITVFAGASFRPIGGSPEAQYTLPPMDGLFLQKWS